MEREEARAWALCYALDRVGEMCYESWMTDDDWAARSVVFDRYQLLTPTWCFTVGGFDFCYADLFCRGDHYVDPVLWERVTSEHNASKSLS